MRLHNRMVKANFWTDTDLIKNLSRDGRMFFQGLWQLADDSGCIEDDVLAFKIHLFPADEDITPDVLAGFRDRLVDMKKLTPYRAEGKSCLYINNFHKHQSIKNPAPPSVPLPDWLKWEPYQSNPRSGKYQVVSNPSEAPQDDKGLQASYDVLTDDLQSSSNHNHNHNHNQEVQPEGKGCGETTPNLTQQEIEILNILRSVENYGFDYSKDIDMIRTFMLDFPGIDLISEIKKWRDYKRDKPLKNKSSPRLQLRNWMTKAVEFERERSGPNGTTKKQPARAGPKASAVGSKKGPGKYADLYL